MLQSSQVLSFFRPRENGGDWTQKELAEFYRVEAALVGSGVNIATDRGLTDEDEPWFVFYRQDNEEVIVHFARIDGEYVVVSNLSEGVARGRNFQALVRQLLDSHPYVLPRPSARRQQTVYLHPATLLAALIVTGYVKSAELDGALDEQNRVEKSFGWVFNRHDLVAVSAIVMAAVWDNLIADRPENKLGDLAWLDDAKSSHELAALTVTSQAPDGQILLGDLGFKGGHDDHSLGTAITVDFAEKTFPTDAGNVTGANVGTKVVTDQVAANIGDHGRLVLTHEGLRLELDRDATVTEWHSDRDAIEAVDASKPPEQVAAVKTGNSAMSKLPSEAQGSSTLAVTSANTTVDDLSGTQSLAVISSVLHIDPQALRPVVLTATNLTDAVRSTLLELNVQDTMIETDFAAHGLSDAALESTMDSGGTASFAAFDDAAREILYAFLHNTPNYRIESFGDDLLIVDTNVAHYSSSQYRVETWEMSDGSTLSILGIVPHHETAMAA